DRTDAFRLPAQNPQRYVLLFKESIRGLTVGAPVQFKGVTIGDVTDVRAEFDVKTTQFLVPVTIELDPVRLGGSLLDMPPGTPTVTAHRALIARLVSRGVRAQLQTGSLLTGALYVAFDVFPDAPPATIDWSQTPPELPTTPGEIQAIEASVTNI